MTSSTVTATARRHFDQAVSVLETEPASAYRLFREATELDPSMADAWLGRIAAGDTDLSTLENLFGRGARLHRESNRLGLNLVAAVRAGPYLSITVTEASHVGIALAGAMVDAGRFEEAQVLLDDDALLDGPENHQWRQHIRGHLMFATQRWPDVIAEAARVLPAHALIMPAVTAGTAALAAHAAAHLGQARLALDWAERVEVRTRCDPGVSVGNDHRTSVAVLDPIEFPLIAADLAYARGMAHRQLDQQDEAEIWLSKAVVNGVPIPQAKLALADPRLQLVVTDEETINSRTDKWDATTGRSEEARAE